MIVSQSNKLNIIPSLNLGSMRNKNYSYSNLPTPSSPHHLTTPSTPMSISPSRKMAQLYKEFCSKYLNLHTLTIRLSSSSELVTISEALKLRHGIVNLNLSHNKSIKDLDAWIAFGSALKMNTQSISKLDLSHNYLAVEGLSPIISDVIRSNKSIQWLNLSYNTLDQDENHSILESLLHNQTITYLDLSSNEYQLSSDISKKICKYIETSLSIETLNFSRNSTRNPLHGLPKSIKANKSLKIIDLSYMTISDKDSEDLIEILVDSKSISSINLFQCMLSTCNQSFGHLISQCMAHRYNETDLIEESHTKEMTEEEEMSHLISALSTDKQLEMEEAVTLRYNSNPMCYFNIGGVNFGRKGFSTFLDILARNQDLTVLDISSTQLVEANGEELANFIKLNESIQALNISNNDFYEMTVSIGEALMNNSTITSLNLSNTKSSNLIGKVLARTLSSNHHLKILDISHTKLGYSGILDFANGLGNNHITLEVLYLNDCDLQDKGATQIGDALLTNVTLSQLYLNSNSIEKEGAKSIAKSLKRNNTLKVLHLGYNQIGVKGMKSIGSALKINRTLLELSLRNNLIPEKGGVYLADNLKTNHTLEILNLRGNCLSSKGGNAIVKLLSQNHFLINIDVSHNQIEKELTQKITSALKKNQYITSMNISQTEMESITMDSPRFIASGNSLLSHSFGEGYNSDSTTSMSPPSNSFVLQTSLSCFSLPTQTASSSTSTLSGFETNSSASSSGSSSSSSSTTSISTYFSSSSHNSSSSVSSSGSGSSMSSGQLSANTSSSSLSSAASMTPTPRFTRGFPRKDGSLNVTLGLMNIPPPPPSPVSVPPNPMASTANPTVSIPTTTKFSSSSAHSPSSQQTENYFKDNHSLIFSRVDSH